MRDVAGKTCADREAATMPQFTVPTKASASVASDANCGTDAYQVPGACFFVPSLIGLAYCRSRSHGK